MLSTIFARLQLAFYYCGTWQSSCLLLTSSSSRMLAACGTTLNRGPLIEIFLGGRTCFLLLCYASLNHNLAVTCLSAFWHDSKPGGLAWRILRVFNTRGVTVQYWIVRIRWQCTEPDSKPKLEATCNIANIVTFVVLGVFGYKLILRSKKITPGSSKTKTDEDNFDGSIPKPFAAVAAVIS